MKQIDCTFEEPSGSHYNVATIDALGIRLALPMRIVAVQTDRLLKIWLKDQDDASVGVVFNGINLIFHRGADHLSGDTSLYQCAVERREDWEAILRPHMPDGAQ